MWPLDTQSKRARSSLRSRDYGATSSGADLKRVQFDTRLEDTRLFFADDVPRAVSTNISIANTCKHIWDITLSSVHAIPRAGGGPLASLQFRGNPSLGYQCAVKLKEIHANDDSGTLTGYVLVRNLAFEKHVVCRYSFDNWSTYHDTAAKYCKQRNKQNSLPCMDWFQFVIPLPENAIDPRDSISLCIQYCVNGHEWWDNNNYQNYLVQFQVGDHQLHTSSNGLSLTAARYKCRHLDNTGRKVRDLEGPPSVPLQNRSTMASCNGAPYPTDNRVMLAAATLSRRYNLSASLTDAFRCTAAKDTLIHESSVSHQEYTGTLWRQNTPDTVAC